MKSIVRSGLLLGTVLTTAALAVAPASAGAAPVKAKSAQQLALHCTKLGDVTVILNGNGTWTPGHIVGSKRVLKPYEIHITGTFTPTGGTAQPFTQDSVKPAPASRKLDECTFHQETSNAQGSTVIDGSAKVQYSGKRLP
jgi:uncharacterized Zn-binding protein involved in type VI secretion